MLQARDLAQLNLTDYLAKDDLVMTATLPDNPSHIIELLAAASRYQVITSANGRTLLALWTQKPGPKPQIELIELAGPGRYLTVHASPPQLCSGRRPL